MSRSRSWVGLLAAAALLLVASADADAAELTFARSGGAEIPFTGTPTVRCGPWEPGARTRSVIVELRNRTRAWQLRAVLADVAAGRRIRFPTSITDAHPDGAVLFVAQRRPLIEASTSEEEASG